MNRLKRIVFNLEMETNIHSLLITFLKLKSLPGGWQRLTNVLMFMYSEQYYDLRALSYQDGKQVLLESAPPEEEAPPEPGITT